MEKEFVPYEPSLVLKELGFDGKCLAGFYTYADENLVLNKYDYRGKFNINYSGDDDYIINTNKEYYVSAPLFSQVFRWFREKYGYDVSIKKCTSTQYKFVITQSFVENDYYFIDFPFPSHKNAELECLKKLIEIVKRKVV